MKKVEYTNKKGAKRFRPVMTEAEYRHSRNQENEGFCLGCGETVDGVEPDARAYEHEDGCGAKLVYGLEELLMMGLLTFDEETAAK